MLPDFIFTNLYQNAIYGINYKLLIDKSFIFYYSLS